MECYVTSVVRSILYMAALNSDSRSVAKEGDSDTKKLKVTFFWKSGLITFKNFKKT